MHTLGSGDWQSWLTWFFEWLRSQFGGSFPI
jgi:hypothetical protein